MAGLYIHIPFCKKRCIYCDFYSTNRLDMAERYVAAVVEEARLRRDELSGIAALDCGKDVFKTVYVGGGTPSQLTTDVMARMVAGVGRYLRLDGVEEFTVEVNPDDVSEEYVSKLAKLGVNRVSMGVQSFNDAELAAINRRHNARCATEAYRMIREAGIRNVSIDLIYGLPGQTIDSLDATLAQAVALRPEHISAYCLTFEQGTELWRRRAAGLVREADEEMSIEMYRLIVRRLRGAGYEHYEISNYALPGYWSHHNSSYWDYTPYVGLGAAAHSFDGVSRRYNPSNLMGYIDALEHGRLAYVEEKMSREEHYDEEVMMSLRTSAGLSVKSIGDKYGPEVRDVLLQKAEKYVARGIMLHRGDYLSLTDDGMLVSDAVIEDLMWG